MFEKNLSTASLYDLNFQNKYSILFFNTLSPKHSNFDKELFSSH